MVNIQQGLFGLLCKSLKFIQIFKEVIYFNWADIFYCWSGTIESVVSQESIDRSTKLLFPSSVISGATGVFRLSSSEDILSCTGICCWSQVFRKLIKFLTKSSATLSGT